MEQTGGGLVKICDFLQSLGGIYDPVSPLACEAIAYSLASGQYVIGYEDEKILYFSAYWRIDYDAVEAIRRLERPSCITSGPLVYVVEAGSTVGMRRVVNALHKKNPDATHALFHRGTKLKQFRLLRGGDL